MIEPFIWGANGEKLTPDQVARLRDRADAARELSVDTSPVAHWTQGAARIVSALVARRAERKADEAERAGLSEADAFMQSSPLARALMRPDQAGMAQLSPVPAALAQGEGLPASLIQSESGGDWTALNSEGYGGRGQFGDARLTDAARAGVIPAGMTGAQYSQQPQQVQEAVENWHKQDILGNLGQYVGVDVDGPGPIPPLTEDSILAVAHLGGTGGAQKFIQSGGAYNPSDSNGTSLADYATRHAVAAGQMAPSSPGAGPSQEIISALIQAQGNPWVQQKYGPVVEALIGQQIQQSDPKYQAELERLRLANQAAMQPAAVEYGWQTMPDGSLVRTDSTGNIQNMGQFAAPQEQYQTVSGEQAAALGLDPSGAYNVGPDGKITQIGGGGTNVTVNNPGSDEFAEAFAKGDAATIETVSNAGLTAQRNMARLDRLESMLSQGPSGMEAGLKSMLGEYGVETSGLDLLQASQALINQMVPEQRQPGSGPMSDADLALFKQSLPRLINTADGNALIVHTLRGIMQYDAEGGAIAQRLRAGEIDRATAFQMLQDRQNPLAGFSDASSRFEAPAAAQGLSGDGWQEVNGIRIRRRN